MQIEETGIEGLIIIKPTIFPDKRGYFYESYNKEKYNSLGINQIFIQDNISKSSKDVLRGLHFQNPPHAQAKLISVLQGSVLDIAVDIRKDSPTYGHHYSVILSEENKIQFLIPAGFAHGFVTLENDTIFSYKCSNLYDKKSEGSIKWDDQDLKIDWNVQNPIISEKDLVADSFKNFKSKF